MMSDIDPWYGVLPKSQQKTLSTEELRKLMREKHDNVWMHLRPEKRSECPVNRPCPYVGCRYNLTIEVLSGGLIRYTLGTGDAPEEDSLASWVEKRGNCVFDYVMDGGMGYAEIARVFGVSRQRIQCIEAKALGKLLVRGGACATLREYMDKDDVSK